MRFRNCAAACGLVVACLVTHMGAHATATAQTPEDGGTGGTTRRDGSSDASITGGDGGSTIVTDYESHGMMQGECSVAFASTDTSGASSANGARVGWMILLGSAIAGLLKRKRARAKKR